MAVRPGSAGSQPVRLVGADALAAALARADKAALREVAKSNRAVARRARDWTRAAAAGGTQIERRASRGITSDASRQGARLRFRGSARAPMTAVAFFGANKKLGWYGKQQYVDSASRQHRPWVGSRWQVAVPGQGPYVINAELAARRPQIDALYLSGQWDALARAVPSRPR